MRLIKHAESYEVRYPDGTPSRYFYFDDNPGRRAINKSMAPAQAEEEAKTFARGGARFARRDQFRRLGGDVMAIEIATTPKLFKNFP